MGVANYLRHSEQVHNIVNKMVSYHDRAAECAQKSLLTLCSLRLCESKLKEILAIFVPHLLRLV